MSTTGSIPPPMSWAQRHDLVYVIIDVECKDIEHKVTDNTFTFKGVNALDPSKKYDVTLNFFKEVDPEKVTSKNIGRCVEYTIPKKITDAPYWPTLTTDKNKLHFLKANFAKWCDEFEDEDATKEKDKYNHMMNTLSGDTYKNKFDDFNFDEDDSDVEIPSLSENDQSDEDGEGDRAI